MPSTKNAKDKPQTGSSSAEASQTKDARRKPAAEKPAGKAASAAATATATPSMAQFLEIKAANPDSLLWYRMGDFYELFFEDAVIAAQALSIVLTKRGKHLGEDIPMCGVPVVRADEYLERLIRQGYRVAVCEQLEDPAEARKRGSKAVVKRDVVRLVTPGTLTEETLLEPNARNYLTAMFLTADATRSQVVLASLDISTGEFEIGTTNLADLPGELARLAPREILHTESALEAGNRTITLAEHSGTLEDLLLLPELSAVLLQGGEDRLPLVGREVLSQVRRTLANRPGKRVLVIDPARHPELLFGEKVVSEDTTASGGNASLLASVG